MVNENSSSTGRADIKAQKVEEGSAQIPEDIESIQNALASEKARAESYLSSWQRAQADFINLKRRTEQEKSEAAKLANAMLILNLLPVLDDLQRAFDSVSGSVASMTWVDGVRLIYRKLESVLEANGLSQIKAIGEKFDPRWHESVLYKEGDEAVVIEELQRGYKLYDRVIRPTLVVVGKGRETPSENSGQSAQATN